MNTLEIINNLHKIKEEILNNTSRLSEEDFIAKPSNTSWSCAEQVLIGPALSGRLCIFPKGFARAL